MSEEELIKASTEVAKVLAPEVYGDVAKPGAKQVGKALGTLVEFGSIVLLPLEWVNDKVKILRAKNYAKLQARLAAIPEANIVEIHSEIAVPVLQKLEYTKNEELSDLFINLLTSAANIETAHLAHPSFVNVIANLSPDEARLLSYLHTENDGLLTLNIHITYNKGGYSTHFHDSTVFAFNGILQFPENISAYISNLSGLGLIRSFGVPTNQKQFEPLKQFLEPQKIQLEKTVQDLQSITYTKVNYDLTDFGKLFMKCCSQ